jgi:hypothetical protein
MHDIVVNNFIQWLTSFIFSFPSRGITQFCLSDRGSAQLWKKLTSVEVGRAQAPVHWFTCDWCKMCRPSFNFGTQRHERRLPFERIAGVQLVSKESGFYPPFRPACVTTVANIRLNQQRLAKLRNNRLCSAPWEVLRGFCECLWHAGFLWPWSRQCMRMSLLHPRTRMRESDLWQAAIW